jgi:hypothetical protein
MKENGTKRSVLGVHYHSLFIIHLRMQVVSKMLLTTLSEHGLHTSALKVRPIIFLNSSTIDCINR